MANSTTVAGADLRRDAQRLHDALTDLTRVIQFRDRDRACCYDLSVSQCYGLAAVVEEGPVTVNELAGSLYLDKSTASRLARSLEAKGYVRRVADPDDGRVVRLAPTPSGASVMRRIRADGAARHEELLAELGPSARATMIRVVGRLAASLAAGVDTTGGSCCVIR